MELQEKINTLTDIISHISNKRQKAYALQMLQDLVNQLDLFTKNLNDIREKKGIDEVEKYICALTIYGFTEKSFSCLDYSTLKFFAANKKTLGKMPTHAQIQHTQLWLRSFNLSNDRSPKDFIELKEFIINEQA